MNEPTPNTPPEKPKLSIKLSAPGAPTAPQQPAPAAPAEDTASAASFPPPGPKPSLRLGTPVASPPTGMSRADVAEAAKVPTAPQRFASPMPKLDEVEESTPAWQAAISGLAAVVSIACAVLLFLKNAS